MYFNNYNILKSKISFFDINIDVWLNPMTRSQLKHTCVCVVDLSCAYLMFQFISHCLPYVHFHVWHNVISSHWFKIYSKNNKQSFLQSRHVYRISVEAHKIELGHR